MKKLLKMDSGKLNKNIVYTKLLSLCLLPLVRSLWLLEWYFKGALVVMLTDETSKLYTLFVCVSRIFA